MYEIKYEIVVCTVAICAHLFTSSPLRPTGDDTEAETHQNADVEVMEMHQCE